MSDAAWRPTARWELLQRRAALLQHLRAFFDRRGYCEVETPLLSADTVVDRHIDPVPVWLPNDPRQAAAFCSSPGADSPAARATASGRGLWLQTSPEFHMKRLLAAGAGAIYQVARSFRLGEQGARHNPEFTLVEWYRPGDSLADGMQFTSELAAELLNTPPARPLTYGEAFLQYAGVDPHRADAGQLRLRAHAAGIVVPEGIGPDDRDGWLDLLLVELVEPRLTGPTPILLYEYPASQAALAATRGDPPVAERFELYVRGVELANGYHELLDAGALRRRTREQNRLRKCDGKPTLPADNRLLAAMEFGLPDCTGVALGFDRLAMLAFGAAEIADVIPFPIDRA